MPDFRQSGDKPLRPQDHLGMDVELATKEAPDAWASNMLNEIGRTICPPDMKYLGAMAVYIYREDGGMVKNKYELATKQAINLNDTNEAIAGMSLSNLMIEMRKFYGRSHKTTDTKDKRGQS